MFTYLPMETYTRVNSKMEIGKVKGPIPGLINPTTKESGWPIK